MNPPNAVDRIYLRTLVIAGNVMTCVALTVLNRVIALFKTAVKGSVYSSSVYANARMNFAETIVAANIALIV